jgi:GT2 family glycosyltransferase
MSFRRQVFELVGLFDEALGPGGILKNCDDADFTYRMLRAGMKVLYSPEPLIYHTQFRFGKERWHLEVDYGIGAGAFFLKHAKYGDLLMVKLLLDRWIRSGVLHIAYGICTFQRSHIVLGCYRIFTPLVGIWDAMKVPLDKSQGVFSAPAAGGKPDEQD